MNWSGGVDLCEIASYILLEKEVTARTITCPLGCGREAAKRKRISPHPEGKAAFGGNGRDAKGRE